VALGAALALLATGCAMDPSAPRDGAPLGLEVHHLPAPSGPGSAFPHLAPGPNGAGVLLSWTQEVEEGVHEVRFATLGAGGWSRVRTIARGDDFFVNWADFPSLIALPDGPLAAHWLVRSAGGRFDYDIHLALSNDGGERWSAPVTPHRSGIPAEYGFVSLFPWEDGRLAVVWLDGRQIGALQAAVAAGAPPGEDEGLPPREMMLRQTLVGTAVLPGEPPELGEEVVLDPRICECCQTSAAITDRGPVVVYRGRSPDEVRDIHIVRQLGGGWTTPAPVHRDGWRIPGCPVNGPAIDARGMAAVTAWFTGADDRPRVLLAFSGDAGAGWSEPVQVDRGNPLGRVDVMLLDDGSALVLWMEVPEDGEEDAEVLARRIWPSGERSLPEPVARTAAARSSGFPRMARLGEGLVFAWTDPELEEVRLARGFLAMED